MFSCWLSLTANFTADYLFVGRKRDIWQCALFLFSSLTFWFCGANAATEYVKYDEAALLVTWKWFLTYALLILDGYFLPWPCMIWLSIEHITIGQVITKKEKLAQATWFLSFNGLWWKWKWRFATIREGWRTWDHVHSVNLHEMKYIFHVNHLSKTFLFCIFANCLGFSVVSGIGLLIYGDN